MATFLERLDDEARNLLLAVARPVSYEKGARLVRHGDPSRGAYVVREGAAEATVTLPGGETLTVARLEAGGVFGEMALVERGTCTATVRSVWLSLHANMNTRRPTTTRLAAPTCSDRHRRSRQRSRLSWRTLSSESFTALTSGPQCVVGGSVPAISCR